MLNKFNLSLLASLALISSTQASHSVHFAGFNPDNLPAKKITITYDKILYIHPRKLYLLPAQYIIDHNVRSVKGFIVLENISPEEQKKETTKTQEIEFKFEPGTSSLSYKIPSNFPQDAYALLLNECLGLRPSSTLRIAPENFGILGRLFRVEANSEIIGREVLVMRETLLGFSFKIFHQYHKLYQESLNSLCLKNKELMKLIKVMLSTSKAKMSGKGINITNFIEITKFLSYAFGINYEINPDENTNLLISYVPLKSYFSVPKVKKKNRGYPKILKRTLMEVLELLELKQWKFNPEKLTFESQKLKF